jgi:hypothetical protein
MKATLKETISEGTKLKASDDDVVEFHLASRLNAL